MLFLVPDLKKKKKKKKRIEFIAGIVVGGVAATCENPMGLEMWGRAVVGVKVASGRTS